MKDLIARIDFFSGLDDRILKKLADASIVRQFMRNETILRQGETGPGLYVIARGRVRVDREQGGVRMQVAELGPENFFGETSLLDNPPRPATVTGIVDSECLLLTRDTFVKLMNKHPEIPIRMARALAERLRAADEKPAAPAAAAPRPSNGTATVAAAPRSAEPGGAKAKVHQTLLDTFASLYAMKVLTRFSVALLGCPVEGSAPNAIERFEVGDVKVLVFPAGEPAGMRITAREPGSFTLDIFTPGRRTPARFGPVPITPGHDVIASWGRR